MKMKTIAAGLAFALAAAGALAATPVDGLKTKLAAEAKGTGISLASFGDDGVSTAFVGDDALRPDTTFRIASNTKTFTAATVLRLWEDGKIKLDESIRTYVDPEFIALLDKDGYDTAHMTVRHLLTHTSGIADHAQTKEFLALIESKTDTAWTRKSQLEWLVQYSDPVGKPGEKFYYSDSGYCLLGNIVERLTGMSLAKAVHTTLNFEKLGMDSTYWETQEPVAKQAGPRAHVVLDGKDTFDWNASLDMYGGGGIVSTPADLARFLVALFDGKIYKHPETLQMMLSKEGLPKDSPYRMGIFQYNDNGIAVYGHHGFWGTAAMYAPSQHRAYALALTQRDAFKPAFLGMKTYIVGGAH